jgi:rhodanese-related sulfurtransferase
MNAVRQAALILVAALIPALLTGAFHHDRPNWSEPIAPGEERLETILSWGQSVIWVDARPEKEYADAHVPDAIRLTLEDWDTLFPHFLDRWNQKKKVVVYCSSTSCQLSREVAERLEQNGIPSVYVLHGGWETWKAQGGGVKR